MHTVDPEAEVAEEPPIAWVTWRSAALLAVLAVVWFGAYVTGLTYNLLVVVLWVGPLVVWVRRMTWKARGVPVEPVWRAVSVPRIVQLVNVVVLWILLAVAMAPAPVNIQFDGTAGTLQASLVLGAAVLAASALVPARQVVVAVNVAAAIGSMWLGLQLWRVHVREPGEVVTMQLPLDGQWYVVQGGPSVLYNHHFPVPEQRDALDLVRVGGGSLGRPVRAPVGGTVVTAVDGADDDRPEGNHVIIAIGGDRFVLLAHLRAGSVTVEPGDRVRADDVVGTVGSTGNSSEPHLHLQVQDAPTLARATRTWPMTFTGADPMRPPRRDDLLGRRGAS